MHARVRVIITSKLLLRRFFGKKIQKANEISENINLQKFPAIWYFSYTIFCKKSFPMSVVHLYIHTICSWS